MMVSTIVSVVRAVTPTPTPTPDFDLTSVTPTWVGFTVTFLVAAATVFLIWDMVRRIRRVRYRAEIQDRLEAERQAEDLPGDGT